MLEGESIGCIRIPWLCGVCFGSSMHLKTDRVLNSLGEHLVSGHYALTAHAGAGGRHDRMGDSGTEGGSAHS